MTRTPDEWEIYELASKNYADIRRLLKAGAEGADVKLTADEYELILAHLPKEMTPPASRPGRNWLDKQNEIAPIAQHCIELEKIDPSTAVAKTAEHFHCSASTVRNARRDYIPFKTPTRSFFPES